MCFFLDGQINGAGKCFFVFFGKKSLTPQSLQQINEVLFFCVLNKMWHLFIECYSTLYNKINDF